jgi:hypothetical protein
MARARVPAGLAWRVALAGLVSALSLSANARADEPVAPERDTNPQVYPPPSARPNLVLVGAAVTAGWYAAAVGESYLWPASDSAKPLRIPVAGPYMALAKTGCNDRQTNCGTFDIVLQTIFTSLSAVGQTGGVLAMLDGLFVPTSSGPSRSSTTAAPRVASPVHQHQDGPTAHLSVVSVGASLGLGLTGDF